jgi:O-antigen/teichoic acid export membrane protein
VNAAHTAVGRIVRNGMSGAGARILMMLVGFALTPYIVHSLGFLDFGLWATVGALAGYLGILDFGLGGSFVKFIAQYAERNEHASARQVITFGMLFYLGFGLVTAVPVFLFAPALVHLFKMPPEAYPHAVLVFRALFVILIASLAFGILGSCIIAVHRLDLASRNNVIGYAVYAALVAVLLHLHRGISGVIAAQAAQVAVTATLHYFTARRIFGPVWHDPRRLDPLIVKQMFTFGGWTQLTTIFNVIMFDAGRFISAGVVGVASVTYYEIGGRLAHISRGLPGYLLDALPPAATAADARGDREEVRHISVSTTLYLLLVTALIAGFAWGACGPIMRVWFGYDHPYVHEIVLCLTVAYVVSCGAAVRVTVLRSLGRPELETACVASGALTTVAATVLLVPRLGVVGAAMGYAAGWVAYSACSLAIVRRWDVYDWWNSTGDASLRIMAVGVFSAVGLKDAVDVPWIAGLFAHRVTGLVVLGACGLLYVLAFTLLIWAVGAWRFEERRFVHAATRLRGVLLPASRSIAVVALAAGALVASHVSAASSAAAESAAETPRSAAGFVDSVGVNLHMAYGNTPYGNVDRVAQLLKTLHVRHVRDGVEPGRADVCAAAQRLARDGARFTYITTPSLDGAGLAAWRRCVGRSIEAYEAPNEYNTSHPAADGDWIGTIRAYQRTLYRAVKSDPALADLPVIGPSFSTIAAYAQVGDLSASMDRGNLHQYFAGRPPETNGWGDGGYGSLRYGIAHAREVAGAKPIEVTESGYGTAPRPEMVPPPIAARYIPRMFFTQYNSGIERTYQYELFDEGGAPFDTYGLVDAHGAPKPAFVALASIMQLLAAAGAPTHPSPALQVEVNAAGAPVRHTLLAGRDGIYLVLWLESSAIDPATLRQDPVPPAQATVSLGVPLASATRYASDAQGTLQPARLVAGTRLTTPVSDAVTILKLVPRHS